MEVHGVFNGVVCAQDVFPYYSDVVAALGHDIDYETWIKEQKICNRCGEGKGGPCPHAEDSE